jgi:hypothetical protein
MRIEACLWPFLLDVETCQSSHDEDQTLDFDTICHLRLVS